MIISHSRRFCYWKIARTGSNTAELCIRMSGILDLSQDIVTSCHFFPSSHNVPIGIDTESGHLTPIRAIELGLLTQSQYDSYDHYTIVRNPIDRWISAYAFFCRMHMTIQLTPSNFFANHKTNSVMKLQSDYLGLGRVQTFPFADYERSIRTILGKLGAQLEDVPKLEHKTFGFWLRGAKSVLEYEKPELKKELLLYYETDVALSY